MKITLETSSVNGSYKHLILIPGWSHGFLHETEFINLLKQDFNLHIISYPGYDDTNAKVVEYELTDVARYLNDYLINNKIKDFKILAFSMGCQVALSYMQNYNSKVEVVFVGANFFSKSDTLPLWGQIILSSNLIRKYVSKNSFAKRKLVNRAFRTAQQLSTQSRNLVKFDSNKLSIDAAFFSLLAVLKTHIDPTIFSENIFFIYGENDAHRQQIPKNIKYKTIPNCGHNPFNKYSKNVFDLSIEFLRK